MRGLGTAAACTLLVVLNLPGLCHVSDRSLMDDPDTPLILAEVRQDLSPSGLLRWFTTVSV